MRSAVTIANATELSKAIASSGDRPVTTFRTTELIALLHRRLGGATVGYVAAISRANGPKLDPHLWLNSYLTGLFRAYRLGTEIPRRWIADEVTHRASLLFEGDLLGLR